MHHYLPVCEVGVLSFCRSSCWTVICKAATVLQIGYSSAELAVEWLMAHPEEPAAANAGAADNASKDEDEAVKKQLMASLGTDQVPKLEVILHLRSSGDCALSLRPS